MPRIRLLDDRLVSQIAAGEVVERPASVVKELLENALDAGATRLEIDLAGGGVRRIRVADDGRGMGRDDALLAFDRHATSKIATFDDLERVASLGFRGEALASIAAVAKVELTSAEQPGEGTRVLIEGGRVLRVEAISRATGTTIEIRSLFWNVPARRKFLKTRQTELRRCLEVVEGYALARPEVSISVRHEERLLIDAPATTGEAGASRADEINPLRARIGQVFGPALGRDLEAIPVDLAADLAPGVHGLVGSPASAKRGARRFIFVNRRLVRDRAVLAAFYRAVREEWRSDDFPALFLFLDLPPERVDVNVHPQKAEVRFRDGGYVDRVGQLLRVALARARGEEPAPLRTPRTGAPGAGALGWEGLGSRHETPTGLAGELREPAARGWGAGASSPVQGEESDGEEDKSKSFQVRGVAEEGLANRSGEEAEAGAFPFSGSFSDPDRARGSRLSGPDARIAFAGMAPLERAPVPLSGRSGVARPFRLLGQYKGSMILLEGPDGLYVVDQHVAHERILYERLRRELEREEPAAQRLVTPVLLELSRSETAKLVELAAGLEALGFELEELSGGTIALSAAPASLGVEAAKELTAKLASDAEATPENLRTRLLDDFAASMACKAAIKIHHPLSAEKLEALISELFRADNPYSCPHGRPVVLVLTDADLERRLGRR